MAGHTPLPWTTSGWDQKHSAATIWARSFGSPIAAAYYMGGTAQAEANGALIVKAVNMHDLMRTALIEITNIGGGEAQQVALRALRKVDAEDEAE